MAKPLSERLRNILSEQFTQNILKFQLGTIFTIILGLATSLIYTRLLGVERYGAYGVITAFAGLLTIVARFGQEQTLTTFLAEAVGEKNQRKIFATLQYYFQSWTLSFVVYAVLFAIAPIAATMTGNTTDIGRLARLVIINEALQFGPALVLLTLQVQKRINLVVILENTKTLAQVLVTSTFLILGYGIEGILYGMLLVSSITLPVSLVLYQYTKREYPGIGSLCAALGKGGTGIYFREGFWLALERNIGNKLYPNIFYVVLGATASYEITGLFKLAFRLARLPSELIMPGITRLSAVAIPKIVSGDRKALKASCLKLLKGTLGLNVIAILGAIVFVPPLLPVVYGAEYAPAIPLFLVMVWFNLLSALHVVSVPLIRVYRKVWAMILTNVTAAIFAIGVYYLSVEFHTPAKALVIALFYYHMHSLSIFGFLWWFIRHPKRRAA